LLHERRGPLDSFAPITFVQIDLDLGPQRVELTLARLQQSHRLADDVRRVRDAATFDVLTDDRLDVGW
jgi:hypothetical protein